ncbi:MAG: HEAT repeat domain-containing protein [Methanosarcinales archaeon]|nr:HEAT repeat domain-containing protein [Methanosarcinales archaeon]
MNKTLLILLTVALLAAPCMGETNSTDEDVVVHAADAERILLDYSIDTLDVVSMGVETYYVVRYKNIIAGTGIEVFADDGTLVTNASTVDNILLAVAWRGVADQIGPDDISAIKTLVGSPQAIETTRTDLITSCDSLAVLGDDINRSDVTNYEVLAAFGEQVLDVDGKMVEISNGTKFFLKNLIEEQKKISTVTKSANSTRKSLYKEWKGRDHAQTRIFGTLVLIVVIAISAIALIFLKSDKHEISLKKSAGKLIGRRKSNIIDQLHSQDADERARSALMAGASAEINEAVIPHLIVLLDDPDDRVRANTAQSIRRIGQKNRNLVQFAEEPLKRHLDDPNDKVRDAVAEAYQVIRGEIVMEESLEAEEVEGVKEVKPVIAKPEEPEEKIVKAQLTDAQQQRLYELKQSVNQSINDLPTGCDLYIPYYLAGVCTTVVDVIEHADRAESEAIDEMIDAAGLTCKYIVDLIGNGRFIDICISKNMGAFDDTGFVCGIEKYSDQLNALISDPVSFATSSHLEEELWEMDSEITGKMGELMIIPISGLWKVSKNIFDDASGESGVKRAFLILISGIILERIREMMKNPEIIRRLQL